MGKNDGFEKVMNVWKSENSIQFPNVQKQILKIVDQIASPFAAGSFYYFVFNLHKFKFDFVSDSIHNVLGIKPSDFSFEKIFEIMHPEDLDKINEKETVSLDFLLKKIPVEDIPLYKVVYLMRLKNTSGEYKTILHQSKAFNVSIGGKIQQTICIHSDVTHLNIPIDHKMSFISDSRPSFFSIATDNNFNVVKNDCSDKLSLREREILKKMSQGKDSNKIAEELYLSPHTINTHKKNILRKSGLKNTTELIAKCIREGVI